MSRKQYAGIVILEGALLSILSICVSVSLAEGFYIPETWSGRILPALIFCTAVTIYWNLMTFNKQSNIAAILIFIISVFLTIMVLLRADEDLEKTVVSDYHFSGFHICIFSVKNQDRRSSVNCCGKHDYLWKRFSAVRESSKVAVSVCTGCCSSYDGTKLQNPDKKQFHQRTFRFASYSCGFHLLCPFDKYNRPFDGADYSGTTADA